MKKYFLIALLGIASVSASAQSRYESTATTDKSESRYSGQADVYIQDGWGVGGMFRKEINKYLGWNLVGASFMSGFGVNETPDKVGVVNVRTMGLRAHTDLCKNLGVYADVTPGYTYMYSSVHVSNYYYGNGLYYSGDLGSKAHCFGLDVSAGFQLGKHLELGYNLAFYANGDGNSSTHWGRISILF